MLVTARRVCRHRLQATYACPQSHPSSSIFLQVLSVFSVPEDFGDLKSFNSLALIAQLLSICGFCQLIKSASHRLAISAPASHSVPSRASTVPAPYNSSSLCGPASERSRSSSFCPWQILGLFWLDLEPSYCYRCVAAAEWSECLFWAARPKHVWLLAGAFIFWALDGHRGRMASARHSASLRLDQGCWSAYVTETFPVGFLHFQCRSAFFPTISSFVFSLPHSRDFLWSKKACLVLLLIFPPSITVYFLWWQGAERRQHLCWRRSRPECHVVWRHLY